MKILLLFIVLASSLIAFATEPTVTLSLPTSTTYTLQPPAQRVFYNSALLSRIDYSSGTCPKGVGTNPAWTAVTTQAANYLSSAPYTNHNFTNAYRDGSAVFLYAMYWACDNTQSTYLTAAEYLVNNMQAFMPLVCIESTRDCVNGGDGYYAGSYGPAYWMQNWVAAYLLVRSQLTSTQQQTFADKLLNDYAITAGSSTGWCPSGTSGGFCGGTGLGGGSSTSCTNHSASSSATVSFSSGNMTASSAFFGSTGTSVGDWIFESSSDTGGVIASVTDSTHAAIESDQSSSFGSYSGTVFYLSSTWANGNCGWLWLAKHDWYSPASVISASPTTGSPYPSNGANGGYYGTGNFNLVLSAIYGFQAAMLAVADEDVDYSTRDQIEIQQLINSWYTTTWQGLNEYTYTGFTPTGSVYGIWRAMTFYPLTAYSIFNSLASPTPPALMDGVWAKNMAHHFYLGTFPSCPAQEMEYGQSFSYDSSYNSALIYVPGLAGLVTIFNNQPEGEYLNYWLQNLWSTCVNPTGTAPGSALKWNTSGLTSGAINGAFQPWFFLYTDPAYPTNSSLPTGAVENVSDAGGAGLPMAGLMSRTGYSSITDTLVTMYSLAIPEEDHSIPYNGLFKPADYELFRGGYLLGDDDPNQGVYNNGGPATMAMEIGGDTNISTTIPWTDKMPLGHADSSYVYAETDSTQSYISGAHATAVIRHLVHFKKSGTQDFVIVYDYVNLSSAATMQTYLHYANTSYTGGSCGTSSGSTTYTGPGISSSFSGTGHSDSSQILSNILLPAGSNSVYYYTNNSNGTYTGGYGCTFRVSMCASSTGSSCSSLTTGEFAVVHEPIAGSGHTLPTTSVLATIDSHHRGIEVDGTYPKVAVFPIGTSSYASITYNTGAYSGTAQHMVAGVSPGIYSVSDGSGTTSCTVASGDNTCYFESTSGAVSISPQSAGSTNATFGNGVILSHGVQVN